jgi:hypothetical protein
MAQRTSCELRRLGTDHLRHAESAGRTGR